MPSNEGAPRAERKSWGPRQRGRSQFCCRAIWQRQRQTPCLCVQISHRGPATSHNLIKWLSSPRSWPNKLLFVNGRFVPSSGGPRETAWAAVTAGEWLGKAGRGSVVVLLGLGSPSSEQISHPDAQDHYQTSSIRPGEEAFKLQILCRGRWQPCQGSALPDP